MYVYQDLLSVIQFLQEKPTYFLTWICDRLFPEIYDEGQPIFIQGDILEAVYFLSRGKASYVIQSVDY